MLRFGVAIGAAAAALGPVLVGLGLASAAIAAISAPIAAAVIGVGALAAGGVALYANWDSIREQFPAITGVVENLGAALAELGGGALDQMKLAVQGLEQLLSGDLRGAAETGVQILNNMGESVALALGNAFGASDEQVRSFLGGIRDGAAGLVADAAAWFAGIGTSIGEFAAGLETAFDFFFDNTLRQAVEDARTAIGEFVTGAQQRFGEMTEYLAGLRDRFIAIGADIIDGLLAGLREKWESVKAWFAGLAASIPEWVREKLGIQSPSTVFAEIGGHIMDGLRQGLGSKTGEITTEMEGFASELSNLFAGVLFDGQSLEDGLRGLAKQTLGNWGGGFIDKALGGLGASLGIPGFANGTNFAPGGLAWVGERGRELVNLPRGSRVIPNHALRGGDGGGAPAVTLNFAPVIDARGADAGAVARIQSSLEEMRGNFRAWVAEAIDDPRGRGGF